MAKTIATRQEVEALDATDPLAPWRGHFELDEQGPVYMDGNSLGRLSHATARRLVDAADEWGRRLVTGWTEWIDLPITVGDLLGEHILGAAPGQVIAADSTTVNLYKLAVAAIEARPDRGVIVGDREDFPTDRYVLEGVARASGRKLRLMASDPVSGLDPDLVRHAVDDDVALVCLSHVNYRSAARADLAAVSAIVHEVGAAVLWDVSHSAGALPVGLDAAGADLAVGCTYKYLNAGPGAPAFLYVRGDLQSHLRQPIWGWFGQRDLFAMRQGYDPEPDVRRFQTGTPSVIGLAALKSAVELIAEAGVEHLWAKSVALTTLLIELHDAWLRPLGCRLGTPRDPSRRGAHVSVIHPEAYQLSRALIDGGLVVPDYRPPNVIRLGPAPLYTRYVDVWDAMARLRDVLCSGAQRTVDATPGRVT